MYNAHIQASDLTQADCTDCVSLVRKKCRLKQRLYCFGKVLGDDVALDRPTSGLRSGSPWGPLTTSTPSRAACFIAFTSPS